MEIIKILFIFRLSSESRIGSRGDCEFPSDGRLHLPSPPTISPPPPVPPPEKPPKRKYIINNKYCV